VLESGVLDRVEADRRVSIERETFPILVGEGALFAVASDADWIDAGTPAAYLEASTRWAQREGTSIAATAGVDASARVVGSVIEAGATVGADAVVEGSVVLPEARVEAGARVVGSIVGRRAVVGAGARVESLSVLGDDAIVAAGETLVGVRRPEVAL
jgi:mannose-1-phosphate guanylyltransferase